jgi:hypothetical protein
MLFSTLSTTEHWRKKSEGRKTKREKKKKKKNYYQYIYIYIYIYISQTKQHGSEE